MGSTRRGGFNHVLARRCSSRVLLVYEYFPIFSLILSLLYVLILGSVNNKWHHLALG